MCVVLKVAIKFSKCTLPPDSSHILYNIRVITEPQPSMDESTIQKLVCNNEKTVQYGTDFVCHDVTDWLVPFGSTTAPGRCPKCEQDRLYPDSARYQNAFFLPYETPRR